MAHIAFRMFGCMHRLTEKRDLMFFICAYFIEAKSQIAMPCSITCPIFSTL